ncbi:MAG: RusA family crossover junction endodeoxyribonuclease [Candidatus Omnitrophica bacterium]|nr:RusA family crossover junction endodeoxyribonuclease [Candidatus Omnitrophota bacterium]
MMKYKLIIPLKNFPSINHTYQIGYSPETGKPKLYKTSEAKIFQEWAFYCAFSQLGKIMPSSKKIEMKFNFYFPTRKSDLSNYIKLIEDAFQGYFYLNDNQIVKEVLMKNLDKKNPRVEIEVLENE